jgi:hypothetical protein
VTKAGDLLVSASVLAIVAEIVLKTINAMILITDSSVKTFRRGRAADLRKG